MAEAQTLVQRLLALQNPDGGWPYSSGYHARGISWVEPTALGFLALQSIPKPLAIPGDRAVAWLLAQQKTSGGWAPNPSVAECTSVTSLATLALLSLPDVSSSIKQLKAALDWTARQVYPDDLSLPLLFAEALNLPPPHAPGSVAWYPGTAGWVMPTSLSTIALSKAAQQQNRPELKKLAHLSCSYLLSRRCEDQGWNHGGSKTRSESATSYPETTGLALLALRAASVIPPPETVAVARRFAAHPESLEGLSWIQLALQSAADPVPDPQPLPTPRTTRDCALRLITLAAREGRNVLLA